MENKHLDFIKNAGLARPASLSMWSERSSPIGRVSGCFHDVPGRRRRSGGSGGMRSHF